jgi:hypothetical protein
MPNHEIGRLAFRVEGEFWNAYYALPDTMKGSLLLGSLHMKIAVNPARKKLFMHLMQLAMGDLIRELTGGHVSWPLKPQLAPEHERTKNA